MKFELCRRVSQAIAAVVLAIVAIRAVSASAADLAGAKQRYEQIVAEELARNILPGVSIAWVVDGKTVHSAGYGLADETRKVAATPETIYRAGSISKLFNAVAAMQMVEAGKLDLDAPIQQALPEFSIEVPFDNAGPLTARQMLCHRSGMIREAPIGGYLDNTQPGVTATVASVADCALVNPPNTKTRYSNVAPTIVGRAVEVLSGKPFAEYQSQHVLAPLGMVSSAWLMNDTLRPRLAKGRMRVARGGGRYDFEPAPEFELGTIPAGNLYTTAPDLARFAAWLMGDASAAPSPVLPREALEKMFVPQLTSEATGYGLGFGVNRYRGHKTVQHMGAVYGFTTSMVVLPKERIGVIVLSNCDIAVAPVRRLAEAALDLLLEAVANEKVPAPTPTVELPAAALQRFAGQYEAPGYWAELRVENGSLVGELSGQPITLRATSPTKFLADGRIMLASEIQCDESGEAPALGFTALSQKFVRVDPTSQTTPPKAWQSFTGMYGLPFIPLVVSLRHGHLYALAENEYDYRITPENRVSFRLPVGMYDDEQIVFQLGADGKVQGVVMANMYLPRTAP